MGKRQIMSAATKSAPISSHPAFKWGVAGWFALLLGLGLFVMPANVHQLFAERLGIDGVLSGTPLRAALSGAAALLGFVLGLVLAIRVAAINDARVDDEDDFAHEDEIADVWLHDEDDVAPAVSHEDAPRRPLNPREDIEEEGISAPVGDNDIAPSTFADEPDDDSALMELWREEMGDDEEVEPAPILVEQPEVEEFADDTDWDLPEIGQPVEMAEAEAFDEELEASAEEAFFEEAEFEPVAEHAPEHEPEHAPIASEPAPEQIPEAPGPTALGDLSLDALTQRLGAALEAFKAGPVIDENADPVIAFLRREAERDAPQSQRFETGEDPQAELRSALDKLTRVGKPK